MNNGDIMVVYDIINGFKDVTNKWQIGDSYLWILANIYELNDLQKVLVLDGQSIEECIDLEQPSKISFFDGYVFVVFNVLEYEEKSVKSKELNIFLSKDYIITVVKNEINIINDLQKDIKDSKNCLILKDKPQPYILFYYILDRIIVRNYDVISFMEAETDKIEINILKNPKHEQIDELIYLRRQVYKIRKYLNPLRYIGDSLVSNDNSIIDKNDIKYFMSLNNKIDKLMLSVESLVQDLALVREAYESEIANKTNELMKIFTIIATVFLPLNLISSMYGMNVKSIPFMSHDYGYYVVLGIMGTVSFYLIHYFKKKGWL